MRKIKAIPCFTRLCGHYMGDQFGLQLCPGTITNSVAPFYLFSLTLSPGKMKSVGEPPDQGTIYPIIAEVKDAIDTSYLRDHDIPKPLIEHIRDGLLAETVVWSIEESTKI